MSRKTYDGEALWKQIQRLEGDIKLHMEALLEGMKKADEAEDWEHSLMFRYSYACDATFHDDPPKVIPIASEFAEIYEAHPDILGDVGPEAYLMIVQMAIDPMVDLPQIPMEQWEKMMEQFQSLVKRFHLGHRIYWVQQWRFMFYVDRKKALEYFEKFWKTGRDTLSDCRACERCYGVQMYLGIGDYQKAEEHAKPIKSRHLRFCSDTPHKMYLAYIEEAMNRGDLKTALPYARQLKAIGHRDRGDLCYMGAVLRCFAYEEKEQAMQLLEQGFSYTVGMWNKKMINDFYKGAWTVFHELAKTQKTVALKLPKELPVYRQDQTYELKVLEDWLWEELCVLAEAFDARNSSKYFSEDLKALKCSIVKC